MRALPLVLIPALAACGMASGAEEPRSERAQTRLTQALAGKVAGPPRRCISGFERNNLQIIDRNTILFENGRNLVYRNDPEGGCGSLDPTRTIVTNSISGGDLCRGDIVHVIDPPSGTLVGSCAFSDFIPYARPGTARR